MNSEFEAIVAAVKSAVEGTEDKIEMIEAIKDVMFELSPLKAQPVDRVRWVSIDDVEPNDYNPNSVAGKEMGLLYTSILNDGYTQPVVTIWDPEKQKYVIIDGFHRYFVCKKKEDIQSANQGRLPVVVLEKDMNDRMAATVRHNRARGEHSVAGMANLVFEMLNNDWSDSDICNRVGLEPEELLKLKHITGFSALFKNVEYNKSWETKKMIKLRLEHMGQDK